MSPLSPRPFGRLRIVVCDEDQALVGWIVRTLREDGHAVFQAHDTLAAVQLADALDQIDLLISNTVVEGMDGITLISELRKKLPALPILYLANTGRSPPERERRLPPDVPILREPFTADELKATVRPLLRK